MNISEHQSRSSSSHGRRGRRRVLRKRRHDPQYGSVLLGRVDESMRRRRIRVQILITAFMLASTAIGVIIGIVLIGVVLPGPSTFVRETVLLNFVILPVYLVAVVSILTVYGTRLVFATLSWSTEGRDPTHADLRNCLRIPWRLTLVQLSGWIVATAVFTPLYGLINPRYIAKVGPTVALAGIVVSAICYVFTEYSLRPYAAQALSVLGVPKRRPGALFRRSMLLWLIGTGVPVLGIIMVAVSATIDAKTSKLEVVIAVSILATVTLVIGSLIMVMQTGAVLAPVRTLHTQMEEVRAGRLDARVVVFDASELGQLQSGFNEMVDGLRERERVRDLFGRHVGQEVAQAALASESELGGVETTVAVLFVDIVGSTRLAATRPPTEVVEIINRFFGVVVDEIEKHSGLLNKFEGDAALAIFGAPIALENSAGAALKTARHISRRLDDEIPELQAGIGVAYGVAVAGNIGTNFRYEYTVIGDPVNEAARLCDQAKTVPGRILVSENAVNAADNLEDGQWQRHAQLRLRGRLQPTTAYSLSE